MDSLRKITLEMLALATTAVAGISCQPSDKTRVQLSQEIRNPNPEMEEAQALSKSVFQILPEESYFPKDYVFQPKNISYAKDVDDLIRIQVEKVIDLLPNNEKVFIVQQLGLPHAIHNTPSLIEHGIDVYTAQIPPIPNSSEYIFRNAETWIRNKDRINAAKEKLKQNGQEKMRGIALSISAHAMHEDDQGKFDRFFPTSEMLKQLGITRIILFIEMDPSSSSSAQRRVDSPPANWDNSHTFSQLRKLKSDGFIIQAVDIHVKTREEWERPIQ